MCFHSVLLIFSSSPVFTFSNEEEIEDLGSGGSPSEMDDYLATCLVVPCSSDGINSNWDFVRSTQL